MELASVLMRLTIALRQGVLINIHIFPVVISSLAIIFFIIIAIIVVTILIVISLVIIFPRLQSEKKKLRKSNIQFNNIDCQQSSSISRSTRLYQSSQNEIYKTLHKFEKRNSLLGKIVKWKTQLKTSITRVGLYQLIIALILNIKISVFHSYIYIYIYIYISREKEKILIWRYCVVKFFF